LGDASLTAANAAECANEQGKFWSFYTYMYENVPHSSDTSVYSVDNLSKIAGNIGMNTTQFSSCLSDERYNTNVTSDRNDAQGLGVDGSPTFYINGVQMVGSQSYDVYQEQIDKILNGL
jgi:predicted DsbA family dithiol-disulfide isomerase